MANSYFAFKRFVVHQEKCAMKVGTDGVLLGAWADVSDARRVLDVGTGTGLVALMIAQRCDAEIVGLEIDSDAAEQAAENVSASLWKDRIGLIRGDFNEFCPGEKFDLIVSNPPYFRNSLPSPDQQRNTARHDNRLSFDALITKSAGLLAPGGRISLIVPSSSDEEIARVALRAGLYPLRRTYVKPLPASGPKRLLVELGASPKTCRTDFLTVELSRHVYSREFAELTKEYYLDK